MNRLVEGVIGNKAQVISVSVMIAGLFVFVVLPALPNFGHDSDVSIRAEFSFADGDGGGDAGGGGGDGGGDAGNGGGDGGGDAGGPSDPGNPGGGDGGGPSDPIPPVEPTPAPKPTCTISANPNSIQQGQKTSLIWATTNATAASLDNGIGDVALAGSRNVSPKYETTYTLTATGEGGSVTCTATITIVVPPQPAPTCTLSIDKTSIVKGGSATLSWTTTNAMSVSIDNGVGNFDYTGSVNVTPTADTTYTLTATGKGGSVTCVKSITVTIPPAPPTPAPTCTLTASPMSITSGNSSTLTWSTSNASSVSLNNNIGGVAVSGNRSVSPTTNTTYVLTATGANGTSVTCSQAITVTTPPPAPQAPTCSLTANPTTIVSGINATLTWTTSNATGVTIQGGNASVSGSMTVAPTLNTTYTLVATGQGGQTVTCTAPITVTPKPPTGGGEPKKCNMEIIKSVNKTTASIGDELTYTLKVKNIGTANCTGGGVRIADHLPSEVSFVRASTRGDVSLGYDASLPLNPAGTNSVYFNAHTLTPGESVEVDIVTKVKTRAQCGNFTFSNQGKVTAYELNNFGTWIFSNSVPVSVTNACETPAPTCTLSANPNALTQGQSATLTWSTTNASSATLQGGSVAVSGSTTVTPSTSTTYTLVATGQGGTTVTCTAPITVTAKPVPVCMLEASPSAITRGGASTLTWSTSNATAISIDTGIGSVGATGTKSVSPTSNTTYTLSATGNGTTVTCVKTVTVNEPEPDPVVSCDAFTANPGTLTTAGTTTLTWATTNATNVSIDNALGTVTEDGSKAVFVDRNTTFTLTATRGSQTKTCTVPVTIVPNVVVPKCDAFTATPNSVREGNSVTLAWSTTDATAVSINSGVGTVDLDGSKTLTPGSDTTYILTATNGSAQTTCQVSVNVDEDNGGGGGGGGSSSPRCELTASDKSIKPGEKVTLSWKNTRTNDILLKDNRGTELIDTKDKDDEKKYNEDKGSIVVEPTKSTSYTLTALRGSKKKTCTVDIKVEGVVVTSTRSNEPLVAGISLSRLPYTGFDAGPFLTTVFYTLLGLWALFVAYVLVLRKSVVLGGTPRGTIVSDAPKAKLLEPQAILPTVHTGTISVPEVSRMGYMPSLMTAPRVTPTHSMTSTHAPVGYDAYYESYGEVPEVRTAPVQDIPNLPVGNMPEFVVAPVAETTPINIDTLESRAHEAHVLMSTDALNFIAGQSANDAEATELLDTVIGAAKASFPKEDGWVVVNKDKILSLLK